MTLPSHLSMLSGLLPFEHGVRDNAGYQFNPQAFPTLPRLLRDEGYSAGAAVTSWTLRSGTGLGALFDDYDDAIQIDVLDVGSRNQRGGGAAVDSAITWIRAHQGKPFFYFLHLYEPHAPYEPPEPFRSRYGDPYDGEIAAADALVGRFLAELKREGIYDRAVILLTSDHGEGLMDHGEDQHGILLYREAIAIPMMLKLPGNERAGSSVAEPVQLIDIAPTLLKLAGLDVPAAMKGVSLLVQPIRQRTIYSETLYPKLHLGWSALRSLVDDRFQYIEAPRPELYDLQIDPAERVDRLTTERRRAASFRQKLEQIPIRMEQVTDIDAQTAAKLASLGYIGSVAPTPPGPPRNPNDEVGKLLSIKEGFLLADAGEPKRAAEILGPVVAANPSMVEAAETLARVLSDLGEHEQAVALYRRTMANAPRLAGEIALGLAEAELRAGRLDDAAASARLAFDAAPARAHALLARIAIERRDWDEAENEIGLAGTGRAPQPMLIVLEAEVCAERGELDAALVKLADAESQAKAVGVPRVQRLEFIRADVLARLDRPSEAEAAYRREIAAFPRNLQAYANLAVLYFVQGRRTEMNMILEAMVRSNPGPRARDTAGKVRRALAVP